MVAPPESTIDFGTFRIPIFELYYTSSCFKVRNPCYLNGRSSAADHHEPHWTAVDSGFLAEPPLFTTAGRWRTTVVNAGIG